MQLKLNGQPTSPSWTSKLESIVLYCWVSLVPPNHLQMLHPRCGDAQPHPGKASQLSPNRTDSRQLTSLCHPDPSAPTLAQQGLALLSEQGKLNLLGLLLRRRFPSSRLVHVPPSVCVNNDDEHWKYVSSGNKDQISPSTV